jgi:hypothetical protein
MALTALDYIKPLRNLGGGCIPTFQVEKAAATTWNKGDIVIAAAGLAVKGADDLTAVSVLGVALEDAANGYTTALIVPALPGVTFWCRLAGDDAGITIDSALATQRYFSGAGAAFEFSLATVFFLNTTDTGTPCAMIINMLEDEGTAWGSVEFVFTNSAFNAVT